MPVIDALLSIIKLQNLKAIHNSGRVVSFKPLLLSITKLQNLKAIHNKSSLALHLSLLLSITKLQNLKAIHNPLRTPCWQPCIVINHKTTKFESNSQPRDTAFNAFTGCYQSQNYKI